MFKAKYPLALGNLTPFHQGKTRDTFQAFLSGSGEEQLLIVATDRISTHNVVHKSLVPGKGEVLTALTVFWLTEILEKAGLPHHLVAHGTKIYDHLPGGIDAYPKNLHHRAIIVKKMPVIPLEFIFRAYLVGSLYDKYYARGLSNPYGVDLAAGLSLMTPFNPPLFTPTDKSETDDPRNTQEVTAEYPEVVSLMLRAFNLIRAHLNARGLELVDTKFEGSSTAAIVDEIGTPDSSRFCELSAIKPGVEPPWFDKQIARDEAARIWAGGQKIPLTFSPEILEQLTRTYQSLVPRITRLSLSDFQQVWLN